MITETVKGDLIKMATEGQFDVIAHGCNCFCTMGAGIAKQIKERWPEVYAVDCATKRGNKSKLGTESFWMVDIVGGNVDVINMYTQYDYKGYKPISYYGIASCFHRLNDRYKECGLKIGIPKIGAGLAGGDWDIISQIIDGCTPDIDITLVEYWK